ncbi:MAG TPA: type II toxin-antitoxin system VapC family toxin [Edaphobacter sp.]|uniref:type II toxin-antitoxin system VapC family toxin n=1 Tax=Edaphobacter sp. TaxID=1934404 RepID=UPI002CBF3AAD|nr:type II toxin-antitoxin system VapC family toxin [Edaphobacter sp.]HUZ96719.1 type II toxin-antitoxin system VapC family toxin [Edaphobacter sp.]
MSVQSQYLLDTNILSETRKKQADERVISFLSSTEPSTLYISVLTLGELRKGVALKKRSDKDAAKKIAAWVDGLEFSFSDRILGIDAATASLWGELSAQRPRPVIDTLLAATAIVHELTLVTRNTGDVRDIDLRLLDPWKK